MEESGSMSETSSLLVSPLQFEVPSQHGQEKAEGVDLTHSTLAVTVLCSVQSQGSFINNLVLPIRSH